MKIDRTRLFDQRVVQRNIRAGRVTKDEYRAWLGDQADASEKIMAREEGGDDDGYEIVPKAPAVALSFASISSVSHSAIDDDDDDEDDDDDDVDDDDGDDDDVDDGDDGDTAEAEAAPEPPSSDEAG